MSKKVVVAPQTPRRITIFLPFLPPSTNHSHMIAHRGKGVWRIRRPETVEFMENVAMAMVGMVPLEGPVGVEYVFSFADRRRDVENALKTLSDSLSATNEQKKSGAATGYILHNDRQIEELHAYKKVVGKSGILGVEILAWTL